MLFELKKFCFICDGCGDFLEIYIKAGEVPNTPPGWSFEISPPSRSAHWCAKCSKKSSQPPSSSPQSEMNTGSKLNWGEDEVVSLIRNINGAVNKLKDPSAGEFRSSYTLQGAIVLAAKGVCEEFAARFKWY
jgi:hypothetical protein